MAAFPGTTGGIFQISESSSGKQSVSAGELFGSKDLQTASRFEHAGFAINEDVRGVMQAFVGPFYADNSDSQREASVL